MGRPIQMSPKQSSPESGQAILIFVVALGTFLLGVLGFAVDFAGLYFHQQRAQSAADAACQAAGMDLLTIQEGLNTAASAGFTPGTGFTCTSASTSAPCKYAAFNGYSSPGLTAGTESNSVTVSFPSSVTGVTAPPAAVGGTYPFIEVDVVERVRVFFSAVITLSNTQDVKAIAKCGLQQDTSPIPILVLDTNTADLSTFNVQGTPNVTIYGGPTRSIQVNSPYTSAISLGGNGSVNLSFGGPDHKGSIMGTSGGPYTLTNLLTGSTTFTPDNVANYAPAVDPISDPFAQLAAPSKPANAPAPTAVLHNIDGCPDPAGCDEYSPGYYGSGITVQNRTAIFLPGIYYVNNGFNMGANSILRPAIISGAATGSMFYLTGSSSSVSVASNSGTQTFAKNNIDQFNTTYVSCPKGATETVTDASGNALSALDGNVLLGMCTGTYGDPLSENRGMLFYQDHSSSFKNKTSEPNFGGGGSLLLAGNMYFHNTTNYSDLLTLGGGSGSGTYVLGDIVTDQLTLSGTSFIGMDLNPTNAYNILKVELLQ